MDKQLKKFQWATLEEIKGEGFRIGIPVPFPMKYVYCYLLPSREGYFLVDAGANTKEAKEAWKEVFQYLSLVPEEDINAVYITHFHPDHVGLAGWIQENTGAPVYMHPNDIVMMNRVWAPDSSQPSSVQQMVVTHGAPLDLGKKIAASMKKLDSFVSPLPTLQALDHVPYFLDTFWEVRHTPGHTDGMFCLYNKNQCAIFSSDLILDPITPNISVWPGASQKPLHEYLDSLQRLKEEPIHIAYTAHGDILYEPEARIERLIDHHHQRLHNIETLAEGRTAYDIASRLFQERSLTPHQWRFAIAETLAHLYYLQEEKHLQQDGTHKWHRYSKIDS